MHHFTANLLLGSLLQHSFKSPEEIGPAFLSTPEGQAYTEMYTAILGSPHKSTSALLEQSLPRLWNGKSGSYSHEQDSYICVLLARVATEMDDVQAMLRACRLVYKRLNGCHSVQEFLYQHEPNKRALLLAEQPQDWMVYIQATRKLWMEDMIVHFRNQGD